MAHMHDKWQHRGMMMEVSMENQQEQQATQATPKPVAYDADGKPLYAEPPISKDQQQTPQVVHMTRAFEPVEVELSPQAKEKHEESMKRYPQLNLSDHEYVISDVKRHPIGLWGPILVTTLLVTVAFLIVIDYQFFADIFALSSQSYGVVAMMGVLFAVLALIGGYLAIWVYTNNRFFLTNESVIQEIQNSIFSRKEQIASLMNIEDTSFSQRGPLQVLLNYGTIRLSTEGDESTYQFDYVQAPKDQVSLLNNAVEAFKNGRPVQMVTGKD